MAFAQVYRARPAPRAPVLVVTAARDAAQRAAEVGADGYLAKPFDLDDLLGFIGCHLTVGQPAVAHTVLPAAQPLSEPGSNYAAAGGP